MVSNNGIITELKNLSIDTGGTSETLEQKELVDFYSNRFQQCFDDNCAQAANAYLEHMQRNIEVNKSTKLRILEQFMSIQKQYRKR